MASKKDVKKINLAFYGKYALFILKWAITLLLLNIVCSGINMCFIKSQFFLILTGIGNALYCFSSLNSDIHKLKLSYIQKMIDLATESKEEIKE